MSSGKWEFSARTRENALKRFQEEQFDILVIGGGITGAAVARDGASRGLKVAVVERNDFAFGTSSRSSKLVHGGLRYLENLEFGLVFEALAERALLLRTAPHMVRPLPFYFPVFEGDPNGKFVLGAGLWLYDLLALFRTPGFHRSLSRERMLRDIPFLRKEGLKGGFRYFDASMWDDVLAVETLRSAHFYGAAVANYIEATGPLWSGDRITGFRLRDREGAEGRRELDIRAHRVVVCAGPWTDSVGGTLLPKWQTWLQPSKGVHLIFDLKRIPIPGAMVMNHPEDGRISFVVPRPDMGAGIVIVGTTDGPTPAQPESAQVEQADVDYLLQLLNRYFPELKLGISDILSAYVGVRPLMGAPGQAPGAGPGEAQSRQLQKISREHHIAGGPGGTVIVAGGKYTTHRRMAEEIVDFTLKLWKKESRDRRGPPYPTGLRGSLTKLPVNARTTPEALLQCQEDVTRLNISMPPELVQRYGRGAFDILEIQAVSQQGKEDSQLLRAVPADPEAFPHLAAQLRNSMRTEMTMHLEDFYLRRQPLFNARADHGLPWVEGLARIWADERGLGEKDALREAESLRAEFRRREEWRERVK